MTIGTARTVDEVISARFSCRAFQARRVSRRMIEDILRTGRSAPSGANIQPGRVYVVSSAVKDRLSMALQRAHLDAAESHVSEYSYYSPNLPVPYRQRREQFGRIFYGALGIPQADIDARARQTAKNYDFFGAPVGMIVTIDRRLERGSWLDLGMFVQTVLIAAEARGLQSCPQETFAKYHKVIRLLLSIPDNEMIVCGLSLGFADQRALRGLMPRAQLAEFATFSGFDDPDVSEQEETQK